jgi:hypothetical protein
LAVVALYGQALASRDGSGKRHYAPINEKHKQILEYIAFAIPNPPRRQGAGSNSLPIAFVAKILR